MYYGKLPLKAEFMRANMPVQDLTWLDEWIQQGLLLLTEREDWKSIFSLMPVCNFCLWRSAAKYGLVGSWMPSFDETSRRYPFMVAAPLEMSVLGTTWNEVASLYKSWFQEVRQQLDDVLLVSDPSAYLTAWESPWLMANTAVAQQARDGWQSYTLRFFQDEEQTVYPRFNLVEGVLALFLLLPSSGSQRVVRIPLATSQMEAQVGFWLSVCREILLGKHEGVTGACWFKHQGRAELQLLIGGLSPKTWAIQADLERDFPQVVRFDQLGWVSALVEDNPRLQTLRKYLLSGDLSLSKVLDSVRITAHHR